MSRSRPTPFHPLVRALDRRLRADRLLRDLAWLFAAAGVALLAPRLAGEALPALVAGVSLLGAAAVGVRYFRRRPSDLARAAAAGDRGGELSDELGSAQWFASRAGGDAGPRAEAEAGWEAYQVARARRRADELDPKALAPVAAPRRTLAAAATFGVLLVGLPLIDGPLLSDALRARLAGGFSDGAAGPEGSPAGDERGEDPEDARLEARSPEEVLAELRAGELPLPEIGGDAEALRAALAEAMEERAFSETNEEVTAALAGLAEAMDSADGLTASEWLDELTEAMRSAASPEELRELLESLGAGAEADAAAAAEMMGLMESGMSPEEALQQLAENLQGADGQQGSAPGDGQAQQMPFPGDGEGGGQPQAGEGGEPAAGMPQGAAGMSGQVQMVSAEGQMGAPMPMDAGPAGNMTGPGGGGESEVFGAVTSLEVQLELEAIPAPLEEEPVPEQMIERQSRREDASVEYDEVRPLSEYEDEAVSRARPIPAGLRPLVRAYFLMIRETAVADDAAEGAGVAGEGPANAPADSTEPLPEPESDRP